MRALDWMRNHLLVTALCFVIVTALTALSGVGLVVWLVAAVATSGTASTLFQALLVVFLGGALVGTLLSLLSLVGVGYGLHDRASEAVRRGQAWLTERAAAAERRSLLARLVGVSDLAASVDTRSPSARVDDRVDRLKRRYAQGAISEREFERRVGAVIADGGTASERDVGTDERLADVTADLYAGATANGRRAAEPEREV